jgi:hypothetical protein
MRNENLDHTSNYVNMNERNEELYIIQQKIAFYKEAINKQKSQMDNIFNIKK